MKTEKQIQMTAGKLFPNIVLFSLPLMLSNILQVLFNMSDIAVVGKFAAGPEPLGSVGSCAIPVSLFTGLLIGMGGGINAITARYIGAGDRDRVRRTTHTSLIISLAYGMLIMIIGLLVIEPLLVLLGTKEELIDGAILYMKVYLIGSPALALYNYGNGVLSAAGDPKHPLYYLSAAGVINILLNLFFVIVCRLDVMGVALASIISQYLSSFLILIRLFRTKDMHSLTFGELAVDKIVAKSVLMLGIPAGLQNAIFAVANLFIQAAVNSFDAVVVEGNSAAANADAFIYDLMAAIYVACTTFMSQNLGAGKKNRVLKSYIITVLYSFFAALVFGVLLFIFGREFMGIFTNSDEVVEAGINRLSIMAFSYCISAFMDCTIAASRGLGKTVIPTIIVITGSCVFRIIWVYTIFAHFHTIESLYLLYSFSWTLTAILEIAYFIHIYKKLPDKLAA